MAARLIDRLGLGSWVSSCAAVPGCIINKGLAGLSQGWGRGKASTCCKFICTVKAIPARRRKRTHCTKMAEMEKQKLNQYWQELGTSGAPATAFFTLCNSNRGGQAARRPGRQAAMLQRRLGLFLNARANCPRLRAPPPVALLFSCNKHTFNYQQPENPYRNCHKGSVLGRVLRNSGGVCISVTTRWAIKSGDGCGCLAGNWVK